MDRMADSGSADMGSIPVGGTAKRVEALLLPVFFHPFVLSLSVLLVWLLALHLAPSVFHLFVAVSNPIQRCEPFRSSTCGSAQASLPFFSCYRFSLCRGWSRADGRNHHCRFCWYGLCEKWSLLLYNPDQNRNHLLMTNPMSWSVSLSSTQQ